MKLYLRLCSPNTESVPAEESAVQTLQYVVPCIPNWPAAPCNDTDTQIVDRHIHVYRWNDFLLHDLNDPRTEIVYRNNRFVTSVTLYSSY